MLRMCLTDLVPAFAADCQDEAPLEDDPEVESYHRVMREFTYTFGVQANSLGERQLKELGDLVNACVEMNDDLGNAVSTCFLEHLHQVRALKTLWPYLSAKARAECHA